MNTTMSDQKTPVQEDQNNGIEMEDLQQAVNQEASPLFDFLVKNAKVIGIALGVIVLVAAGYAGTKAWSSYSQNQAMQEMAHILTLGGEERINTLKEYAPNAPETVKGGALFELAGALMTTGDFEGAAEIWKQIEELGNPAMRTLAQMGRARCLLLAERADDAYAQAKALMDNAPEALKAPGNRLLAACAEAAGDKPAAAAALQALLDSGKAVDGPLISYRIQSLSAE